MQAFTKFQNVTLPDWCEVTAESKDANSAGVEEIDVTPIDSMVGMFLHKDFGGKTFGGTVVSTDTCKDSKKKMYVEFSLNKTLVLTPTQP